MNLIIEQLRALVSNRLALVARIDSLHNLHISRPSETSQLDDWYMLHWVMWTLSDAVFSLPNRFYRQSKLSRRILRIYYDFRRMLDQQFDTFMTLSENLIPNGSQLAQFQESCDLCDSPINFEAMQWARCSKGHRFGI